MLNPLTNVDQHMMDDSDVAGPILFCLLFGAFLLLVHSSLYSTSLFSNIFSLVWQSTFRLHLWCCSPWIHLVTPNTQSHVPTNALSKLHPLRLSLRLLPSPTRIHLLRRCSVPHERAHWVFSYCTYDFMVHILGQQRICECTEGERHEAACSVSIGAILQCFWHYGDLWRQGSR